jgi:uncharacterized protein
MLMRLGSTTKMDRLSLYASTIAFQWVAAAVILWRAAAHAIPSWRLGLAIGNPALTAVVAGVACALVFCNQIFSLRKLASHPAEARGIIPKLALKLFPQDDVERLAFFALVATVSVCEELIYRGFVQCVFQDWARSSLIVGILGSAVYFSLAHLYQGRRGLVSTFAAGLIFSGMRAWTGSLIPSMCAHFVADLSVGFMAVEKLRTASPHSAAGESFGRQQ